MISQRCANSLTNKFQDNPEFEHIYPREFYWRVRKKKWTPITGDIPPIESIQRNLDEERDLQLKNSDEYTFGVLPDPKLYDIYERDLLHRVKEYKWRPR